MYIFKPIYLWWELLFQHGVIMVMTTKGTTEEDNKLVRKRHHGVLQHVIFFFPLYSNSSPPILIVTMIPFGCMALWSKGRCPFPDVYRVIAQQVGAFPLFFPCLSSLHL